MNIASFYFVAYILTTFNNLGISFHAAKTDYNCIESYNGSSTIIPPINDEMFRCDGQCIRWQYNNSVNFKQTIISEFELICGNEWLSSFSQSIYQIGYVLSGILIGFLSDSYGRYRALCVAIVCEIIGGIMLIMSNSIYLYTISRFVLGFGDSGRGLCLYMLLLETVGKRYRTDSILSTSFGWVIGYLLLPLVAFLLQNYRYLQMVPTISISIMCLLWLPYLPESPRWLITNGRNDQARDLVRRASKRNGKLDQNFEKKFDQLVTEQTSTEMNQLKPKSKEESKHNTVWSLLRSRQYCSTTLILWFSFYINGFIYHGFNLNVDILGGDVYTNFALAGLFEIPSMLLNLIGMKYLGRKCFTVGTILSAALCYSIIVMLQVWWPMDHWSIVVCSMLGKMFIFSTYNAIYIHAGEIFPTELRHSGVSSCSIAARFGSIVAPFVASFGVTITMSIFGLMSFVTAFLTILLPETKDKELVDHI
ncbi:hypothetical protein RDWZM_002090 [Blomia tropicalis]|uniref:Major facilitator superfamily (MFS) profile domain-containing protein n=1 Tax=Blomia tropicalis TaxID=40697 RepID=A0A9Q0MCU5_BLOTA|nr:hypothetical protein RDWZM_002090 [Blomia tropicalis]